MGISGIQVPYCTGRNTPSHAIAQDACDCHHHIYDPPIFPIGQRTLKISRRRIPRVINCFRKSSARPAVLSFSHLLTVRITAAHWMPWQNSGKIIHVQSSFSTIQCPTVNWPPCMNRVCAAYASILPAEVPLRT